MPRLPREPGPDPQNPGGPESDLPGPGEAYDFERRVDQLVPDRQAEDGDLRPPPIGCPGGSIKFWILDEARPVNS